MKTMGRRTRGQRISLAVAAVLALGSGTTMVGCFFSVPTCEQCDGNTGGSGGGPPTGCVPSENTSAVDVTCGVFVASSGDDMALGTKDAPLLTLEKAIEKAMTSGGRVYACAETFTEAVDVPAGVTLYGGLDCTSEWQWIGQTARTILTAAEGVIPLRLSRGGSGAARLEDMDIVAVSIDVAANPTLAGSSSIAAVAEDIAVELVRCSLTTGDAAPGQGASPPAAAMPGANGTNGSAACTADTVLSGGDTVNDCGTPDDPTDDSLGGNGGVGTATSGSPGNFGTPGPATNGGNGEVAAVCTDGQPGIDGTAGDPGAGATGLGAISSTGYAGVTGADGTKGTPGQGGGGGGGARGGTGGGRCSSTASDGGASGGSGASGGCGGVGGRGGGAGGSSIALISLGAQLSFDGVTLSAGRGGDGGPGSAGQTGGAGGQLGGAGGSATGFNMLNPGCAGGRGGNGGDGGLGGGGLGGHSLGIAYTGMTPPSLEGVTITPGNPGLGGASADAQHNGADGVTAATQGFQ